MRRVVVTGLGLISPVGNTVQDSWHSIIHGESGIDVIPSWRDSTWAGEKLPVYIAGEVKNFSPEDWITPKKDIRRMDKFIQFAVAAGIQAMRDANLPEKLDDDAARRAGTIVGVGLIGVHHFLDAYDTFLQKGPHRVSPFFIPSSIANLAPGHLAIRHNLKGPCWAPVSACASGAHAIGEAMMHIRHGRADIMLCGGTESALHPLAASGFSVMQALSTRNDDPKGASRPFDKERDGFVMGEGAGILVLEELEHAKARDARIYAELVGYGSTCDAFHITAPAESGEGAQRAMTEALTMAQVEFREVDYINAHGTSTPFNDKSETSAIKEVFKDHAKKLLISSTKSMTGHLLGAAGGVEAIFSTLAIANKIAPPTINYQYPDPECDLNYVPNEARNANISTAMSNSFGFGGTNAVLLFREFNH